MESLHLSSFGVVPFYVLNLALFLIPGFAVMLGIGARRTLRTNHAVAVVVASSASLGYIAFWIYFGSKIAGEIFSYATILSSAWLAARALRGRPELKALGKKVLRPFGYALAAGLFYSCLFFAVNPPFAPAVGLSLANVRFFKSARPGDNVIPFIFAERIYDRKPVRPFCCGDWLSSDRPPLQAGIFLLQRPLRLFGNAGLHYQLLGTALQCLWVAGIWTFLKTLGASENRIGQALGFLVFSGFLFYNSLYVWPKLLAATFILFAFSILFEAIMNARRLELFETSLAALCIALAVMAHPGSVFSLPGLLLIAVIKQKLPNVRQCAWGALIIIVVGAPWLAYQKFYDPPGNRLLKMHLPGVYEPDPRTAWQTIKQAYEERSPAAILHYKWANISTLLGPKPVDGFGLTAIDLHRGLRLNSEAAEASRIVQREYIWNAVGVLNAGWFAGLALLLMRRRSAITRYAQLIAAAVILNLIVWSTVLFGPGQTFTTHSSYADILLLSAGLLSFLLALPPIATISLLLVQLFNFFAVWVWVPPVSLNANGTGAPALQIPLLICAAVGFLVFIWYLGKSYVSGGFASVRQRALVATAEGKWTADSPPKRR